MSDPELLAQLASNLATNLRYLRTRSGLTQTRLAERAGIPRSTLANLETGSGNPTLAVLAAIGAALHVTLEELLGAPRGLGQLYPRGTLPIEHRGGSRKATVSTLLPDPIPGMEITRMELEPGAKLPGVPHRPGAREYLYCEEGQLVLIVAGERFELGAGDVCAFRGDQPHSYANPGERRAIGIGVVTIAPGL